MANIINYALGNQTKRKTILWLVIILVAALLLLIVINSLFYSSTKDFSRLSNWVDLTKHQAVFLSNGQVYFGKVTDANSDTLVVEGIYYLRASRQLQAPATEQAEAEEGTEGETQEITADKFSLIKLGNEIHGPEDKMNINLNHVLFVEDLKSDSKVVEAIKEYESKE